MVSDGRATPAVGEPPGEPTERRASGGVVGAATAATITAALTVFLVGALAVQIRHSLRFDATAFGVAISVYYLGAGAGSVPAARLAETIGGVRVMRAACVAAAVVLALLAAVAGSWATLTVLLFAAGLVSGAIQPAINLFLSRRARPDRQGTAFGIKQAAVPASALLAGLAVPGLALTVGWRWAFVAAGALAMASAAVIPRPRTTLAERRSVRTAAPAPGTLRPLVVLAVGFGLGIFAATGLSAFAVTSAVAAGITKSNAGLLIALGGAVAVGARVIVGVLADRRGRAHLPVVAGMLVVGGAGYGVLAMAATDRSLWLFVAGVVIAFGAGWGWNGLFNFAVVRTHAEAPARATGVTQVGGRLAGAVGPFTFGLLVDHVSYTAAWAVDGSVTVAAALVILVGRRLLRRRLATEAATSPG